MQSGHQPFSITAPNLIAAPHSLTTDSSLAGMGAEVAAIALALAGGSLPAIAVGKVVTMEVVEIKIGGAGTGTGAQAVRNC